MFLHQTLQRFTQINYDGTKFIWADIFSFVGIELIT